MDVERAALFCYEHKIFLNKFHCPKIYLVWLKVRPKSLVKSGAKVAFSFPL
jgi:hypothetical protein